MLPKRKAKKKKEKSALFCLTAAVLLIIVVQIFLIGGSIITSRVIPKLDDNAYEIFSQTVKNRAGYIESEMYNRWSKIDDFIEMLATAYPNKETLSNDELLNFLEASTPILMEMLRDTNTTGSFIILDDNVNEESAHSCLYFIDSDPSYNDLRNNSDLMILKGPLEFLNKFKIPLHIAWNYGITLDEENRDMFYKPYEVAKTVKNANHLGHWDIVPSLYDAKSKTLTYTKPLISKSGKVFGVAGIEVSQDYLYKLLPETEITGENYNGYAIIGGTTEIGKAEMKPLMVKGAVLQNMLPYDKPLNFKVSNRAFEGYEIGYDEKVKLNGHYEKLKLYNENTPFNEESIYILGVTTESSLTRNSCDFTRTLMLAIAGSLLICVAFSIIMGFLFSVPLQTLRKKISAFHPGEKLKLGVTGILEVDALSNAVEQLNEDVLNSVLKTDKIIDMVNLDIGSFEYRNGDESVKISQALANMLKLPQLEDGFVEKEIFSSCLYEIKSHATQDNLYAFGEKWLKLESVTTENGEFGIVLDATKDELFRIAIKRERDFDALTGIYNRYAFGRVMLDLFSKKEFTYAAFVMSDLDNLKHVNDTYGHDAGDKYIKAAAQFISNYWSDKKAVFARMSGDEFYTFIYGYDSIDEIRKMILSMHLKLNNEFIELPDDTHFRLKMSSGIAWYPQNASEFDELSRYADFAMYQGKHTVKGGVREFDKEIYKEQSYLFTGKEELYTILDEQLFEYVFQPIVSAIDGTIYGYEALIRPGGKTINSPDKLLHIAQLEGQLSKVERNTFFTVLELAVLYHELFNGCKLFINSVPNQVLKECEYLELSRIYSDYLPNLVVEITESENINDASLCRKKSLIKQWGSGLAVDDYGTGYANDKLLLNLEPNYIKIDKFLVDGIEYDKGKLDIVKKTITFAQERGILIIAEGVETQSQLSALMAVGVDLIQGYFVARPMPIPNFDCTEISEIMRKIRS